jgi:hypothetical protein
MLPLIVLSPSPPPKPDPELVELAAQIKAYLARLGANDPTPQEILYYLRNGVPSQ